MDGTLRRYGPVIRSVGAFGMGGGTALLYLQEREQELQREFAAKDANAQKLIAGLQRQVRSLQDANASLSTRVKSLEKENAVLEKWKESVEADRDRESLQSLRSFCADVIAEYQLVLFDLVSGFDFTSMFSKNNKNTRGPKNEYLPVSRQEMYARLDVVAVECARRCDEYVPRFIDIYTK
eukprot:693192-Rhodomonas_salina.1